MSAYKIRSLAEDALKCHMHVNRFGHYDRKLERILKEIVSLCPELPENGVPESQRVADRCISLVAHAIHAPTREERKDASKKAYKEIRKLEVVRHFQPASEPEVVVERMVESVNGVSYFPGVRMEGRVIHFAKHPERYKNRADYLADSLKYVLGQAPKPDLMEYMDPPEEPAKELKGEKQTENG